jgi:Domain of unknown function (DUF1844)
VPGNALPDGTKFPGFFSLEEVAMAEEEEKKQGKGFTVQDRRRFSETGESRDDTQSSTQVDADSTKPSEESLRTQGSTQAQAQESPLPEINFSTFVISLSTQALMHLGEIENPLTGKVEPDVLVAKQMIDIIGMLREKTRGNLNAGEDRLIEDILFDLRMKYVEAVKKSRSS